MAAHQQKIDINSYLGSWQECGRREVWENAPKCDKCWKSQETSCFCREVSLFPPQRELGERGGPWPWGGWQGLWPSTVWWNLFAARPPGTRCTSGWFLLSPGQNFIENMVTRINLRNVAADYLATLLAVVCQLKCSHFESTHTSETNGGSNTFTI